MDNKESNKTLCYLSPQPFVCQRFFKCGGNILTDGPCIIVRRYLEARHNNINSRGFPKLRRTGQLQVQGKIYYPNGDIGIITLRHGKVLKDIKVNYSK